MKVEVKILSNSEKELFISIDPKEMEKFLDEAANQFSKNLSIKGFRKGNIPRNVVEGSIGKETVWQDAVQRAVNEIYRRALEQENIIPISQPKINVIKSVPENNLEFKSIVPVMPSIELPDYKEIAKKIIKQKTIIIQVEDKEVEESLKWLQQSKAEITDNKKTKILPELNDEFAKNLGNFKSINELKESIRNGLKQEKENQEKQKMRLRILEEISKKIDLAISDILIEDELNTIEDEFSQQVASMDTTLEEYSKKIGKTIEEIREGWKEKSKERVEFSFIMKAIAEKENINPSEREIEEEVNKYFNRFKNVKDVKLDLEQLKQYIKGILKNEKVFQLLENN